MSDGVLLAAGCSNNVIGGLGRLVRNTMAFNARSGIHIVDGNTGNAIRQNSIFSNGWLNILLGDGPEPVPNDPNPPGCPSDLDTGANNLQNHPVIASALSYDQDGTSYINITGTLNSTASTTFTLDFFYGSSCGAYDRGDAQFLVSSADVQTGADCMASFDVTVPRTVPAGSYITATATSPDGDTSELAPCWQIPYPVPEVWIENASMPEGNGGTSPMNFVVHVSRSVNRDVTVQYATADGTGAGGAHAPADYIAAQGTLTIAAGEIEHLLPVSIVGNTYVQPDRMFTVALSNPVGASLRPGGETATGTIVNDDTDPRAFDLAVTKITVPKKIVLSSKQPRVGVPIAVQFQNRSAHTEYIRHWEIHPILVTVGIQSLGSCQVPLAIARTPGKVPIAIKSKAYLTVTFDAVFDCANDPAANTAKDQTHGDYVFTAHVDHRDLDDMMDTHPADDTCPRSVAPPFVVDPNPDGRIKDKGCGGKKTDGTFGLPVGLDVVVK